MVAIQQRPLEVGLFRPRCHLADDGGDVSHIYRTVTVHVAMHCSLDGEEGVDEGEGECNAWKRCPLSTLVAMSLSMLRMM